MPDLYYVNVSSVQAYMKCPFRWVCAWVENRVPADDARPLRFGKLLHKVYERHQAEGMSMQDALALSRSEWQTLAALTQPDTPDWSVARDALADLEQIWEPMLLWKDRYPFEIPVLEAEAAFTMPHPMDAKIIMRGRPDRAGVHQGRVYHVQNRSLASGVNFPLYLELQKRSYHEHLYGAWLAQKYPQYELGGTFYNLYRKLKYRKKATVKQVAAGEPGDILHPISELFWQHPMTIDLKSSLHEHVMKSLLQHIHAMQETERRYREDGVVPPPNESIHGGPYGNSVDPYYRVLTGEIELSDDQYFKNRESTYAVTEEA